jgi:hypothetical protein
MLEVLKIKEKYCLRDCVVEKGEGPVSWGSTG